MFNFKSYCKAGSIQEAILLLKENPEAHLIAGGTDVLVKLHKGKADFDHLIDIHGIVELDFISQKDDGDLVIGPLCCFTQVAESALICKHIPVLSEAIFTIGGPQVRNMATVGGNICNGVPSADSAAPLLVLNAVVVLKGPQDERHVPLHEFYQGPGRVDRQPAEIMTALRIAPDDYRRWSARYYKYAMRDAMDIATIGCAAACTLKGDSVSGLRLAFTVAGPTPLRCWKTEEKARGALADQSLLQLVRESVLDDLRPRDSWRAPKAFREHVIKTLAERVLQKALNQCGVSLS